MAAVRLEENFEVCIVGAGAAGLSAALILGRCLRRVVVFDSGKPRNFASRGLHGFLTRDGIHPLRLREIGREELTRYTTVSVRDAEVADARQIDDGFEVRPRQGGPVKARILLLATGRVDLLPEKKGFREFYGRGVYHCAICDAWEQRGGRFVVLGAGRDACEMALGMLRWSPRVTLCTDGVARFDAVARAQLGRNGIVVDEAPVAAVSSDADGNFRGLELANGRTLECDAVFFDSEIPQKSPLGEYLGCTIDRTGAITCDGPAAQGVPGLFVAGNVRCGLHLAITAAAEGVEAAIAINEVLRRRELR